MENLTECANCAKVNVPPGMIKCGECGEAFDPASLDSVMFHETHKPAPDIQYSGSKRVVEDRSFSVYVCPACGSNRETLCACHNDKCPETAPPRHMARKVIHSNIGECFVDIDCLRMQRINPDSTSMYVLHDGEIKEVTKAMVTETDFDRASGDCVCTWCNKKYYEHPHYKKMAAHDGSFPLRQLCDGRIVKL
jgi:Zn finger protein HypA/HybF involved in hydrogenase expression